MGLRNSVTSPCLFFGTLFDGKAPIYVGFYVDDIIYFSPSEEVEWEFERHLSSIGEVDFMSQVSHFLCIKFT
jgi:acid phosphatase class B